MIWWRSSREDIKVQGDEMVETEKREGENMKTITEIKQSICVTAETH